MKITVRGVLLCPWCCDKDPDFMDVWLREGPIVAVVIHCRNCGKVHYSHSPVVDDEIIVRANRMHWIMHSEDPIFYSGSTIIGYRRVLTDDGRVLNVTPKRHIPED